MVSGVTQNNNTGYVPNIQYPQTTRNIAEYQQPNAVDEFVYQLESEHKKTVVKKNIIGGTIAAASALALAGGTFMKGKLGRFLTIAPLALTTLGFGGITLAKGNKTPDFRGMIETMANADKA